MEDQSKTISFLSDPATYRSKSPVERIETHISIIFLVGTRAYKLKKALKLPYVDFSSPSIRQAACVKEVALNSVTAPGLYLAVRRITAGANGVFEFDGEGPLVDSVVEMVRFEQGRLFDRMAKAGKLTPDIMTLVAHAIAAFHSSAPLAAGSGVSNIASVLDINDEGFSNSHVFASNAVWHLQERFRARMRLHASVLNQRAASGLIRRCHGDLHLRNICLMDGHPRLFDCIEFDDRIATTDVLYDLAFLLMDLWHRDLHDLSNLTMNRYLDAFADETGISLLPFFMALRAAVRAHVTATQAEEPGQDRKGLLIVARNYFELADNLLVEKPRRLIAIGGFSGSGKSTVAERLASQIGAPPGARILESDRIRKSMHGVESDVRLPADAYSPPVSEQVYNVMARRADEILQSGGSVVADAVFSKSATRSLIEGASGDTPFCGIWLDAPSNELKRRVSARIGGVSDAGIDILARQLSDGAEYPSWLRVDALLPPSQIVRRVVEASSACFPPEGRDFKRQARWPD